MSRRITEAELRQMYMAALAPHLLDHPLPARQIVGNLVAEVRRLRGLIVPAADASGLGVHSSGCDLTANSPCVFCRAMNPLGDEAQAIRDETAARI